MFISLDLSTNTYLVLRWLTMISKLLTLITTRIWSGCWRLVGFLTHNIHTHACTDTTMHLFVVTISLTCFLFSCCLCQNDVSDILDLTFSMDADEEKHILYEKNQVCSWLPYSTWFDMILEFCKAWLMVFVICIVVVRCLGYRLWTQTRRKKHTGYRRNQTRVCRSRCRSYPNQCYSSSNHFLLRRFQWIGATRTYLYFQW